MPIVNQIVGESNGEILVDILVDGEIAKHLNIIIFTVSFGALIIGKDLECL